MHVHTLTHIHAQHIHSFEPTYSNRQHGWAAPLRRNACICRSISSAHATHERVCTLTCATNNSTNLSPGHFDRSGGGGRGSSGSSSGSSDAQLMTRTLCGQIVRYSMDTGEREHKNKKRNAATESSSTPASDVENGCAHVISDNV